MTRPRHVRAACWSMAAVCTAIVAAGVLPTAAAAVPARPAPRAGSPALRLISQPITVGPDDPFTVVLEVDGATAGSDLVVDIYHRVDSPAEVGTDPEDSWATFDPIPLDDPHDGMRTFFTIDLFGPDSERPAGPWAWELDEAGVYPVRVKLRDAAEATRTTLVTDIVRRPGPGETVTPAQVAVLPRVHQGPAERADDPVSTTYLRRLDRVLGVLRSHPTLPLSFSVTPETVEELVEDDRTATATVLGHLRTEARRSRRELLDAPYVDIDPTSLVANGLADELGRQRDLGRDTLTDLLAAPTAGTWDMPRALDAHALIALRTRGIFRLVLPDDALRSSDAQRLPRSLVAGDGTVRALTVDTAYAVDGTAPTDPVLAGHQLLARIAAAAVRGGSPRIVVPVDVGAADALSLPIVLDALTFGSEFFRATTVSRLFGESSTTNGTSEPVSVSPRRLGQFPDLSREAHAAQASYASMVPNRPELAARFDRPLAIAASTDLPLLQRQYRLVLVQRALDRRFHAVATPPKDKVTLGGRDAKFPLIITSSLTYKTRVLIELEANDRLSFPTTQIERDLDPGRSVAQIRVRTRASGDTPVRITVRSADGREVLAESRYTIRSTAVSGVGILLTIGAAAFLAAWWGRNWYRTRHVPKHARSRKAHSSAA